MDIAARGGRHTRLRTDTTTVDVDAFLLSVGILSAQHTTNAMWCRTTFADTKARRLLENCARAESVGSRGALLKRLVLRKGCLIADGLDIPFQVQLTRGLKYTFND